MRLSAADLPRHFSNGANIGLLLGSPSHDLVDVDLDAPEAVAAAETFLPNTDRIHGRPGKPRSHYWYTSPVPATKNFEYVEGKDDKTMLVEIRSTGRQTLVPPSLHPSGEKYEWYAEGDPAQVDAETLTAAVSRVAACALLARKWPGKGVRHEASLALAGALVRAGWTDQDIAQFIEAVTRIAGDEDSRERIRDGRDTRRQIQEGGKATSLPTLKKFIGDKAVDCIAEWLHLRRSAKGNGTATATTEEEGNDTIPDLSGLYVVKGGVIGYMKPIGRGDDTTQIFVPLCNFTAQVVEETIRDNGVERSMTFAIEGRLSDGQTLPRIQIPAPQFAGLSWITGEWGVSARISAGQASKDRLREAIQVFSAGCERRTTYVYTGWRKAGDSWLYLHAGGAIGANGQGVDVDLEPPLNRYRLPAEPENVPEAVTRSLSLLGVAPYTVTVPLLSAAYLAPLAVHLRPDFAPWLYGPTGSMKSTLAALFLSHYGHFPDKTALPASWESTENALEKRLFTLKDALAVVDDYAPQADPTAQAKISRVAQRLVRAQGNLSGRSRMRADTSLRPDYPPRGLMVSTGEDLPPGQSVLARLLTVEVDRAQIDVKKLTEAQEHADRLPHALAGYIAWLAPQMDELKDSLTQRWKELRKGALTCSSHLRGPEIVAHLSVGLEMFLRFAVRVGAVSEDQAGEIYSDGWDALLSVAQAHDRRVRQEDPAEVFLQTLSSLLAQNAVHVAPKDAVGEGDGGGVEIGWQDEAYLYLIPDATRAAVARCLRDAGGHFPHSPRMLYKAMEKRGALVPGKDQATRFVKIGPKSRRVIQVPRQALDPTEG